MSFRVPETYRIKSGLLASTAASGNNGAFNIPILENGIARLVRVIASDQEGWEHVSVSLPNRTPSWGLMCQIKDLFWPPEAWVMQYHPSRDNYVNFHKHCLHLWRPVGVEFPTPPSYMVGPLTN